METTELKVEGMTCGSCVASVTKALKRVPGVQGVEVDLGSGIARVSGEHATQQVPALLAALSDAGYGGVRAGPVAEPVAHREAGCHGGEPKRGGGCCGH